MKIKTVLLTLTIALAPLRAVTPQADAQVAPACFALVAIAAGLSLFFYVRNKCLPQYCCIKEKDIPGHGCRIITRKELQLNPELQILAGPYTDARICQTNCAALPDDAPPITLDYTPNLPETFIYVESAPSLNGPWTTVNIIWGSPDDESVELYHTVANDRIKFVRAWY